MQIGPKIIRAEEAVGRYVQGKAGTVRDTLGAAKFTAGNLIAGYSTISAAAIVRPQAKVAEHISRALGFKEFAETMKHLASRNYLIEFTEDMYKFFGVPKSGEFMTQDIRKSISEAKTAIKNLFKK